MNEPNTRKYINIFTFLNLGLLHYLLTIVILLIAIILNSRPIQNIQIIIQVIK